MQLGSALTFLPKTYKIIAQLKPLFRHRKYREYGQINDKNWNYDFFDIRDITRIRSEELKDFTVYVRENTLTDYNNKALYAVPMGLIVCIFATRGGTSLST